MAARKISTNGEAKTTKSEEKEIKKTNSNDSYFAGFSQPQSQSATSQRGNKKTKVTIHYDVGFNNFFTIRGKGGNLNWEKGQPLKNVKTDEWVWETDSEFTHCQFKVLINDTQFELGEDHHLAGGSSIKYTPKF